MLVLELQPDFDLPCLANHREEVVVGVIRVLEWFDFEVGKTTQGADLQVHKILSQLISFLLVVPDQLLRQLLHVSVNAFEPVQHNFDLLPLHLHFIIGQGPNNSI